MVIPIYDSGIFRLCFGNFEIFKISRSKCFSPKKWFSIGESQFSMKNYSSSELLFYSKKTLRTFRMAPNIFLFPNDLPNAFSSNISLRTKKLSFSKKFFRTKKLIVREKNERSNKISFRGQQKIL